MHAHRSPTYPPLSFHHPLYNTLHTTHYTTLHTLLLFIIVIIIIIIPPQVEALLDRAHGEPPLVQYVTGRLEALGYHSWAQRVVNSAAFGVPNRRRRVFIVASMHGDARDVLLSQVRGVGGGDWGGGVHTHD